MQKIESKISEQQNKNLNKAGNVAPIKPGSVKKAPGGVAFTVQAGGFPIPGKKKSEAPEKQKQSKNISKMP